MPSAVCALPVTEWLEIEYYLKRRTICGGLTSRVVVTIVSLFSRGELDIAKDASVYLRDSARCFLFRSHVQGVMNMRTRYEIDARLNSSDGSMALRTCQDELIALIFI